MMKKLLIGAFAACVLIMGAAAANAATMIFSTGNGSYGANSYSFTVDGVTAVATPLGIGTPTIHQYSGGLGVISPNCYSCSGDTNHQVDGRWYGEAVRLTFSEQVYIERAMFTYVGSNDGFSVRADGGSWSSNIDIPNDNSYEFSLPGLLGTVFDFGALQNNDDWKFKGIEFSRVSTVPLPPAVLMFGAALVGLGWFRRRKMQA